MKYNSLMRSHSMLARLAERLLNLTGWFTIAVVALISYVSIPDSGGRWLAVGLVFAFGAVDFFFSGAPRTRYIHVFLAVQTLLTIALMFLKPNTFGAPILFFILSAEAMVCLPLPQAGSWILAFVLITGTFTVSALGWVNGLLNLLPFTAGYSFFGAFGKAMRDAQTAREESQRLLDELRAAQSQLQQLAVAEERNRLSGELHDALGHRLTVAVVQLEGAQRLIPTDPDRAARMIGAMREQLKEALGDLRRTVATLRTPLEDDLPLAQSLTRLAQNFQEGTGLEVQLTLPPQLPELPAAHRLALYRAAQEALTNAQKHAQARHVWLSLNARPEAITLTANDDGQGLPGEINGDGFGLKGLRERAAQLGGELQLGAGPHGGAHLQFTLPLHETTGEHG